MRSMLFRDIFAGFVRTRRILRQPSSQIARILGSMTEPELMHRDNLVVL